MKHRFVFLVLHRPHAMHAAHVVDAIHAEAPAAGNLTLATPTIASRVTSAASCSSLKCSVPAGRSGKTKYRNSAVLSHTRTSMSSGISRPNSRNTPRGSMTERERYGADLYQTGGSP